MDLSAIFVFFSLLSYGLADSLTPLKETRRTAVNIYMSDDHKYNPDIVNKLASADTRFNNIFRSPMASKNNASVINALNSELENMFKSAKYVDGAYLLLWGGVNIPDKNTYMENGKINYSHVQNSTAEEVEKLSNNVLKIIDFRFAKNENQDPTEKCKTVQSFIELVKELYDILVSTEIESYLVTMYYHKEHEGLSEDTLITATQVEATHMVRRLTEPNARAEDSIRLASAKCPTLV